MSRVHVRQSEGEALFDGNLLIAVTESQTNGAVSILDQTLPGKRLIPGHIHQDHDVWIYVLAGEVGVRVGDEEAVGGPGDYLLKPRGIPHAMWNPGDVPSHFLEILTPGHGEQFFRAVSALPDDTSEEEFDRVSAENGIRWFPDWDEDLSGRHGVRRRFDN